mmetsp:Transcript_80586/g.261088  ORF Transcript_80586/g.261088 Transcript_80586/m.261088 type:complete len:685 (+) Transcript_80586:1430-3484(+)
MDADDGWVLPGHLKEARTELRMQSADAVLVDLERRPEHPEGPALVHVRATHRARDTPERPLERIRHGLAQLLVRGYVLLRALHEGHPLLLQHLVRDRIDRLPIAVAALCGQVDKLGLGLGAHEDDVDVLAVLLGERGVLAHHVSPVDEDDAQVPRHVQCLPPSTPLEGWALGSGQFAPGLVLESLGVVHDFDEGDGEEGADGNREGDEVAAGRHAAGADVPLHEEELHHGDRGGVERDDRNVDELGVGCVHMVCQEVHHQARRGQREDGSADLDERDRPMAEYRNTAAGARVEEPSGPQPANQHEEPTVLNDEVVAETAMEEDADVVVPVGGHEFLAPWARFGQAAVGLERQAHEDGDQEHEAALPEGILSAREEANGPLDLGLDVRLQHQLLHVGRVDVLLVVLRRRRAAALAAHCQEGAARQGRHAITFRSEPLAQGVDRRPSVVGGAHRAVRRELVPRIEGEVIAVFVGTLVEDVRQPLPLVDRQGADGHIWAQVLGPDTVGHIRQVITVRSDLHDEVEHCVLSLQELLGAGGVARLGLGRHGRVARGLRCQGLGLVKRPAGHLAKVLLPRDEAPLAVAIAQAEWEPTIILFPEDSCRGRTPVVVQVHVVQVPEGPGAEGRVEPIKFLARPGQEAPLVFHVELRCGCLCGHAAELLHVLREQEVREPASGTVGCLELQPAQ